MNTYDIETFRDNSRCIPFCVSFIFKNNRYSLYFNNKDIVFESIEKIFSLIKKDEVFYIHNLKFDGSLIIESLSKQKKFVINTLIENNEIYFLEIVYDNKKLIFRCSYKLLPLSLKNIAKGFELSAKIDYPYNFINFTTLFWKQEIPKEFFESNEGFIFYNKFLDIKKFTTIYCENDCLITSQFVNLISNIFKKELNIDIIKKNILSSPSLSYYSFFKKFNFRKINKYIDKEIELYIRDSYFGGRCEVFGNPSISKKKYIFHFDFPGMYGLCMKEQNVFGEVKFINNYDSNNLEPGFYNIDWISKIDIPVLPHHNVINNKLLFTNGVGNGTYWFEEINLFKKMGGIVAKINSGLIYSKYDFIFNDFVNYFEKFRNINKIYKTLGKLMINSFYGRNGLKPKTDYSFIINNENDLNEILKLSDENKIEILNLEEINNIWLISIKISENLFKYVKNITKIRKEKFLNIAIASSITSKARIKLYNGFVETQKKNGRILYCDTDSIIAEFDENVGNQKHGEIFWDTTKKDTIILDAVFCNPKSYGLKFLDNEIVKIKGVQRDYISFDKMKKLFYEKKMLSISNISQLKNINFKVEYRTIEKKIDLVTYNKRKFDKDLTLTSPFWYENGSYK